MPREPKKKRSEEQREYMRRYMVKLYAERRARGLCVQCGVEALPGKRRCSDCLVRAVGYQTARRKRRKARGLCIICGTLARPGKLMCSGCGVLHASRAVANRRKGIHAKAKDDA